MTVSAGQRCQAGNAPPPVDVGTSVHFGVKDTSKFLWIVPTVMLPSGRTTARIMMLGPAMGLYRQAGGRRLPEL